MVILVLFGCTESSNGLQDNSEVSKPNSHDYRVAICLNANDATLFEGKEIKIKDLMHVLKEKIQAVPKEKVQVCPQPCDVLGGNPDTVELSLLELLIRTEKNVRFEEVAEVLDISSKAGIRRTCFIHPNVNKGKEIKLWLFAEDRSTPRLDCIRIRLLWVQHDNPEKELRAEQDPEGKNGITIMNVGVSDDRAMNRDFMKNGQLDWQRLEEMLRLSSEKWIPTKAQAKPFASISAMRKVDFKDVLRCVSACQKADISEIWLEGCEKCKVWHPPLPR